MEKSHPISIRIIALLCVYVRTRRASAAEVPWCHVPITKPCPAHRDSARSHLPGAIVVSLLQLSPFVQSKTFISIHPQSARSIFHGSFVSRWMEEK